MPPTSKQSSRSLDHVVPPSEIARVAPPSLRLVVDDEQSVFVQLWPAYEAWLRKKGHRPRGIQTYRDLLQRFVAWLGPGATMLDITVASVERYTNERAQTCGPATVRAALGVIRSFSTWAINRGLRTDDPTEEIVWPRRVRPLPRALSHDTLHALWLVLEEPTELPAYHRWIWRRNRRAIYVMLYAGLRIAEAAHLEWRDVDFAASSVFVREGKYGKDRMIPLARALRAELERVPQAERHPFGAVAGQPNGAHLTHKSMQHIFRDWLGKRGIKASAHQFRHTFATQLLASGANLKEIQELMGHESLRSTEIYLKLDMRAKQSAVDRLPDQW